MKKQILEEIKDMKYLLNYNRGRILSEQPEVDMPNIDEELDMVYDDYEDELPSFDLGDIFKGMSKSNGDMDTRTYKERQMDMRDIDMDTRTPKEREMDMGDIDMELDEELDYTLELEEDMDFEMPTMEPGTKERTITTPGIKPGTKPATPYKPKPGPKKNPKAEKGEMPTWLSFDELGIDFE
jgi:hypothetical protein